jgi:large subunit ribosomal protein L31
LHYCTDPTDFQLIDKVAACNLEYMMKTEIHPAYQELKATCSCGNVITVGSTRAQELYLDVCSACHPFTPASRKLRTPVDELIALTSALVLPRNKYLWKTAENSV